MIKVFLYIKEKCYIQDEMWMCINVFDMTWDRMFRVREFEVCDVFRVVLFWVYGG